jgi:hypothetical protein
MTPNNSEVDRRHELGSVRKVLSEPRRSLRRRSRWRVESHAACSGSRSCEFIDPTTRTGFAHPTPTSTNSRPSHGWNGCVTRTSRCSSAGSSAVDGARERDRRALRPHRPRRMSRLAADPQPAAPRADTPGLRRPLQRPQAAPVPQSRTAGSRAADAPADRHIAIRSGRTSRSPRRTDPRIQLRRMRTGFAHPTRQRDPHQPRPILRTNLRGDSAP